MQVIKQDCKTIYHLTRLYEDKLGRKHYNEVMTLKLCYCQDTCRPKTKWESICELFQPV